MWDRGLGESVVYVQMAQRVCKVKGWVRESIV
jgi:hypothetical protein